MTCDNVELCETLKTWVREGYVILHIVSVVRYEIPGYLSTPSCEPPGAWEIEYSYGTRLRAWEAQRTLISAMNCPSGIDKIFLLWLGATSWKEVLKFSFDQEATILTRAMSVTLTAESNSPPSASVTAMELSPCSDMSFMASRTVSDERQDMT